MGQKTHFDAITFGGGGQVAVHTPDWSYSLSTTDIIGSTPTNGLKSITDRGFTNQEQLDSVGLVHMNGRVYDPSIGRMISADPTVPNAFYSQALNRYSYVYNNPLEMTDPSGFNPCRIGTPTKTDGGSVPCTPGCVAETGSHICGADTGATCSGDCAGWGAGGCNGVCQKPPGGGGGTGGTGKSGSGGDGGRYDQGGNSPWVDPCIANPSSCANVGVVNVNAPIPWFTLHPSDFFVIQDPFTKPICPECYILGALGPIKLGKTLADLFDTPIPKAEDLKFSDTVSNNFKDISSTTGNLARPYGDSSQLIDEIMQSGEPTADPQGVAGFMYWETAGSMNGSPGMYELVVDPKTNTIVHFMFRSVRGGGG